MTGGGQWDEMMLEWATAGSQCSPSVCGPWPFPKKIEVVFIGIGKRGEGLCHGDSEHTDNRD